MCGNCGQIVAHTWQGETASAVPWTGPGLLTGCLRMTLNISYLSKKLATKDGHFCPLPRMCSKWPVIVSMINGHSNGDKQDGNKEKLNVHRNAGNG